MHTSLLREGTFKPSHARKVSQHEPDKDGEDALARDTGKGEDNANEDKGAADEVLEDGDGDARPGRTDRSPAFVREVIGRNPHDEERDHRETHDTHHHKHGEDRAEPGSGEANATREEVEKIDHVFSLSPPVHAGC